MDPTSQSRHTEAVDGWWFSEDYALPRGDGRPIHLGETHRVSGPIVPCENGLHACRKALDTLSYAPGPIVWRVRLSGTIVELGDKLVASDRTYLAGGVDVTDTLRHFARLCALDVIDLWEAPPITRRFLASGDQEMWPEAWRAQHNVPEFGQRARAHALRATLAALRAVDAHGTLMMHGVDAAASYARSAHTRPRPRAHDAQNDRLTAMLLEAIV